MDLLARGRQSELYQRVNRYDPDKILNEEQKSIMALIAVNSRRLNEERLERYVGLVIEAQNLMPSGQVRSRQVLTALGIFSGL